MNDRIIKLINVSASVSALLAGAFLLMFAAFFLLTGFDELWNGRGVWIYGWLWLITIITNGLLMLNVGGKWKKISLMQFVVINAVLFGMIVLEFIFDI
ncbi:MAG: hypothetical protein U9Q03_05785 [Patescibacteria group bacterium]|nr:hypothetical protein [Patescibacteria group bacterium]